MEGDPSRNGYRITDWLNRLGEGYLDIAFRAARKADPNALLYYNDYSIEEDNAKAKMVLDKLTAMRRNGTPIDGIGIQSHISSFPFGSENLYKQNFANIKRAGYELAVTEMDVPLKGYAYGGYATPEDVRAAIYQRFAEWTLEFGMTGFLVWGLYDDQSWVSSHQQIFPGGADPLLLDNNFNKKKSYYAVRRLAQRGDSKGKCL